MPSGTGSPSVVRKREEPRSVLRYHCGLRAQSGIPAGMKRFRLLIVDDEPLIRAGIRDGLSEREDVEIAGECGSVSEALDALRSGEVDLVLLDVELPDGKGFDLIRRIGPERMPAVVFVTA